MQFLHSPVHLLIGWIFPFILVSHPTDPITPTSKLVALATELYIYITHIIAL